MPKKTRRQKKQADVRRKLPGISPVSVETKPQDKLHSYSFAPITSKPEEHSRRTIFVSSFDYNDIKHDLLKTLTLALLGFVVEFILHWYIVKNGLFM